MNRLGGDFRLGTCRVLAFCGLNGKDMEKVRQMRNAPSIRKWMYSQDIISPACHRRFIAGLKRAGKDFYWLVKDEGEDLGVIYLSRLDREHKHAYLGIYANPDPAVKGKGSRLLRCLRFIAFSRTGLKTLKLEVIEDNLKAIKFYRKNGFKMEGRLRSFVRSGGRWKDVLVMGETRG